MAIDPRQSALDDNYEALLMAYAAGLLDEAQRLIVGAHLMLTPQARRMVHLCEALGGAMINSACDPVHMRAGSLQNVLARLDEKPVAPKQPQRPSMELPEEMHFLAPLFGTTTCRVKHTHWHTYQNGVEKFDLPVECKSHAQCLKAAPSVDMPHDDRNDIEITLVIKGSMSDECGHYRRGALVVTDRTVSLHQKACPNTGGIYMVVSSTTTRGEKASNWLSRLLSR